MDLAGRLSAAPNAHTLTLIVFYFSAVISCKNINITAVERLLDAQIVINY